MLFGKEMNRTSTCKTQYLANILPYQWQLFQFRRVRSASIRHLLARQASSLPVKLLTLHLFTASRNRIDTLRMENEQSTINL